MKDDKQKSRKPLLYIAQPNFQEPSRLMQSEYSSAAEKPPASKSEGESSVDMERKKNKMPRTVNVGEEEFIYSLGEKKVEETPVQTISEPPIDGQPASGRLNPVKSFTAMTIDEKLQHLSSMSQYYPCTFSTPEMKIVGKLHFASNEEIVVNVGPEEYLTVQKKDLTGIRINT